MKLLKILFFLICCSCFGQNQGFALADNAKKEVIPFKFINNLIFIPVNVNGVELTFLLDTGVGETILFSLEQKQVDFKNVEKMTFSGLGENLQIEGLKSEKNLVRIGKKIHDKEHTIFIILDEEFNFSSHVGIPVHGIIGYNFFKNQPVQIDYISKKIIAYKDQSPLPRKTKGYKEFPIEIEINKPYILSDVEMTNEKKPSKLLIDLGNSDAVWLFPSLIKDFVYNRPSIDDFLGRGFNGDIYGKRSRIHNFYIGDFKFEKPITAMPDEYSIQNVNMAKDRKGSVGDEILRRFHVIFDYPSKKIYLKKNKNFKDPFLFNMSGLDFKHDGIRWENEYVKVDAPKPANPNSGTAIDINDTFQYKIVLKPIYSIAGVRKDSPAYKAGLQKGDILLRVNGTSASNLSLDQLNNMMSRADKESFYKFEITRKGMTMNFSFELEDPIPYQEK